MSSKQHPPPRSRSGLLTTVEVAAHLALSPDTLRNWRCAGKGPKFQKLEGAVRYHPGDLEAYEQAGTAQSTTRPKA